MYIHMKMYWPNFTLFRECQDKFGSAIFDIDIKGS